MISGICNLLDRFDRRYTLAIFVLFLGLFSLYKSGLLHTQNSKTVKMTLIKQNGRIKTILTPIKTKYKRTYLIDEITFPKGSELYHKRLGKLGARSNFFIKFKTVTNILTEGTYKFIIASDDGFRLKIDNKTICSYIKDRPLKKSTCPIHLTKGKHNIYLLYFQGFGQLGLLTRVETPSGYADPIGKSNSDMEFLLSKL